MCRTAWRAHLSSSESASGLSHHGKRWSKPERHWFSKRKVVSRRRNKRRMERQSAHHQREAICKHRLPHNPLSQRIAREDEQIDFNTVAVFTKRVGRVGGQREYTRFFNHDGDSHRPSGIRSEFWPAHAHHVNREARHGSVGFEWQRRPNQAQVLNWFWPLGEPVGDIDPSGGFSRGDVPASSQRVRRLRLTSSEVAVLPRRDELVATLVHLILAMHQRATFSKSLEWDHFRSLFWRAFP